MKIVNKKPLSEIKEERENLESIPLSLGAIGVELVQRKLELAQTQAVVNGLGQELVKAKLDIANLRGGNA